jgi:hypothetical protein
MSKIFANICSNCIYIQGNLEFKIMNCAFEFKYEAIILIPNSFFFFFSETNTNKFYICLDFFLSLPEFHTVSVLYCFKFIPPWHVWEILHIYMNVKIYCYEFTELYLELLTQC